MLGVTMSTSLVSGSFTSITNTPISSDTTTREKAVLKIIQFSIFFVDLIQGLLILFLPSSITNFF